MKGFTLLELLIVLLAISVLATAGAAAINGMIESHRVISTVEKMKVIAAASDVARRLPGGDTFNSVRTDTIAALLDAYDVNTTQMSLSPMQTYWGNDFVVTTTGAFATVSANIPLRDIEPFEAVATPNGTDTILLVSHQPQGRNRPVVIGSKYNKHHLYME